MGDFRLANKSDLPEAMPIDKIRMTLSYGTKLSRFISSVIPISLKSNPPTGVQDAFSWLALALEIAATTKKRAAGGVVPKVEVPRPNPTAGPGARDSNTLAKRLEEWLRRTQTDGDPESFIQCFNTYHLPSWDHYAHIRLAYLLLVANGRQKGTCLATIG